jgi:hypothetical protein
MSPHPSPCPITTPAFPYPNALGGPSVGLCRRRATPPSSVPGLIRLAFTSTRTCPSPGAGTGSRSTEILPRPSIATTFRIRSAIGFLLYPGFTKIHHQDTKKNPQISQITQI